MTESMDTITEYDKAGTQPKKKRRPNKTKISDVQAQSIEILNLVKEIVRRCVVWVQACTIIVGFITVYHIIKLFT